jgi:hypothetical protein
MLIRQKPEARRIRAPSRRELGAAGGGTGSTGTLGENPPVTLLAQVGGGVGVGVGVGASRLGVKQGG